jgi:hypothetical protein
MPVYGPTPMAMACPHMACAVPRISACPYMACPHMACAVPRISAFRAAHLRLYMARISAYIYPYMACAVPRISAFRAAHLKYMAPVRIWRAPCRASPPPYPSEPYALSSSHPPHPLNAPRLRVPRTQARFSAADGDYSAPADGDYSAPAE